MTQYVMVGIMYLMVGGQERMGDRESEREKERRREEEEEEENCKGDRKERAKEG